MLKHKRLLTFKIKQIISTFCADITASRAAPLLGINRNTINQYSNKFRNAIYARQMNEFERIFGEAEVDESYFGARRKRGFRGNSSEAEERSSSRSLECSSATGESTPRSSRIAANQSCKPLLKGRSTPRQWFTRMVGAAAMVWLMSSTTITFESTTATVSSQRVMASTSTALRISGALPGADLPNSTGSKRTSI